MPSFWIRQTEVLAGGKRFHSDELEIDFSVPFENNAEPDTAIVTIYNLSENSINAIKKEQFVIINAGYRRDVGNIFKGTLQKTVTSWQGANKITEFTVGDGSQQWLRTYVSAAYAEGIQASAILSDLCGRMGLEIARLDLARDLTYPKGRVIDCMCKDAIKQISAECGSEFIISKERIYITPPRAGTATGFLLKAGTGLIGSPEVFEKEEDGVIKKGFKIQMLLNHRITINSIFQVESKTANGTYRVLKGRHTGNFITEVEAVE